MKYPLLALATLAVTLGTAPNAFALREDQIDARERAARKAALERGWEHLENGVAGVANGVVEFAIGMGAAARNIAHERPEIQNFPHLLTLRKGANIQVIYCKPALAHLLRNRDLDPKGGAEQCDESLHKGSFNIKKLQACADRHSDESAAAFHLARQLDRVMSRNEDYDYNFQGKYGHRSTYRELFKTCAKEGALASANKPAPKKKPASAPAARPVTTEVIEAAPAAPVPPAAPAQVEVNEVNI